MDTKLSRPGIEEEIQVHRGPVPLDSAQATDTGIQGAVLRVHPLPQESKQENMSALLDDAMEEPNVESDLNSALLALEGDDRIKFLKREITKLKNQLSRSRAEAGIIMTEIRDLLADKQYLVDVPKTPSISKKKQSVIPVLCIGDIHLGYHYPDGPHAYSYEIAEQRLTNCLKKFAQIIHDKRTSAAINECKLYLMGDIVEGEAMRPGHGHEIEGSVFEQSVLVAPRLLSGLIIALLGIFRRLHIVGIPGNHGRNGPPRGDAHPQTNWDRVTYEVTRHVTNNSLLQKSAKRLKDISWDLPTDRAKVHGADDWYAVDTCWDWTNCIIHGEDLRGKGWGGIPFYGVERMVRRYADIVDHPIDYMYMGHIHVHATIPSNFREIFVNGAVESSTTYARKQLVSATYPSQRAVFYTQTNGAVCSEKIYLDSVHLPHGVRIQKAMEARHA